MSTGTIVGLLLVGAFASVLLPQGPSPCQMQRKTTRASDGVEIVYSACGAGEPALVFIHGGLADRSFWDGQLRAFAARHRVIALDLAGHGESGRNRSAWSIPRFGEDVGAVVRAESARRVVLIGNSLGGPVAIEAALLLPGQALMVVGVDTFQDLGRRIEPSEAQRQAGAWRRDFDGTLDAMMRAMFHPDADPALLADVRKRLAGGARGLFAAIFSSFAGYDGGASVKRLAVPIRCINGDLYPTDVVTIRRVQPDFDAVILPHTGHYPMIERPAEFNRHLGDIVRALTPAPATERR